MFDFEVDALFHVEERPKQGCQQGWRQAAGNMKAICQVLKCDV
jgi:hypothetical protein